MNWDRRPPGPRKPLERALRTVEKGDLDWDAPLSLPGKALHVQLCSTLQEQCLADAVLKWQALAQWTCETCDAFTNRSAHGALVVYIIMWIPIS